MCRFLAYKGAPITLDKLLYQPKNSLIHQSFKAQERPEPLNGDGFGVGWYVQELDSEPAVFVSTTPAWNNRNLRYNASKVRSNCIFAHVRAASVGDVAEINCHPFHYRQFLFMHNGNIGGFKVIKRSLRQRLSDELYEWIQGQTDSEHFFALFLNNLLKRKRTDNYRDAILALQETIAELKEITGRHEIKEPSHLNVALTDGNWMVAIRYVTDSAFTPPTLYHSEGRCFDCVNGVCRMCQCDPAEQAVLIVSEKLTDVNEDWHLVPPNHFVVVRENLSVAVVPVKA
ncbi:class II glutamine amidotransferase [bacterium]|nr:class II glutamine amidotransferase [bacterium]